MPPRPRSSPLSSRRWRMAGREAREGLGGDLDAPLPAKLLNQSPVFGGDTSGGPLLSGTDGGAQERSQPLVATESVDNLKVTQHARELKTACLTVKGIFGLPEQTSLRMVDCGRRQNASSYEGMALGRSRITPEAREMMIHVGERLRWVREVHGKSQAEMAEIVGVTQTAWGKWELGQRTPDRYKLPEVVARLRISIDYLLGNTLEGVERSLALRLAAAHPELVSSMRTEEGKGKLQA